MNNRKKVEGKQFVLFFVIPHRIFLVHVFKPFIIFIMNIFVAKLNYGTSEEVLKNLFEQFGRVVSVKIVMDRDTGRSKGYGFVEMADEQEGQSAIDGLNESTLDGNQIVVKKARPKENNFQRRDNNNFRKPRQY